MWKASRCAVRCPTPGSRVSWASEVRDRGAEHGAIVPAAAGQTSTGRRPRELGRSAPVPRGGCWSSRPGCWGRAPSSGTAGSRGARHVTAPSRPMRPRIALPVPPLAASIAGSCVPDFRRIVPARGRKGRGRARVGMTRRGMSYGAIRVAWVSDGAWDCSFTPACLRGVSGRPTVTGACVEPRVQGSYPRKRSSDHDHRDRESQ